MRGSKLLPRDLSCGSARHKTTPTPCCWSTQSRVSLLVHQVSSGDIMTCHQGNAIKAYPSSGVVDVAPHQAGGSKMCRWATKTQRMAGAPWYKLIHSRISTQDSIPCSHTLKRAKSITNTIKGMLRTKDLITKHLDGLDTFLGMRVTSRNSSNSKIAGRWRIYSSETRSSCL